MDFEKQKSKNFDKVMKDSKSFIVAHTEYYEPEYSTGGASAALIIPEDYFKVENPITELDFYEIEGKHSCLTFDVYTKRGLTFDEALEVYKGFSDTRFNDNLCDYYLEKAETTATEYDERSVWEALDEFQKEINKMPTKEVSIVEEAIARLKAENLTDDTQHNKDVLTLIEHITKQLKK